MLVNHCVYTDVHMLKVSLRNLQTARKPPENARRFLPACKEDRICIDKTENCVSHNEAIPFSISCSEWRSILHVFHVYPIIS